MADAYLDGELRAGDHAKFEAHAAGCVECSAMLDTGKALKATLGTIPTVQAPRSFRITPALLQERAPAPAAVRTTPVLMVARFGAAASVAAFAVVGTLQLSSTSDDGYTAANAPTYEMAAGAAEDAGSGKDDGDDAGGNGEVVPLASESPQIAPPPDGGVGGAGVPEPTPGPDEAPDATAGDEPDPTDGDTRNTTERNPDPNGYDYDAGDTALTALPADGDEADYGPWLVLLGGLSVLSLGAVGTMEYRRRRA